MDCSFNRSYLTESTNSLLTKYFVVDKQLCGDVSYEIFENRICGYAIRSQTWTSRSANRSSRI